ncbi:hypothetical protein GRI62_14290 [Erythrobacter arachoides]|uniref:Glycosyltransferase RgtA/B/C/D-like domain-containing protein n=1 Tax=Aurantiacibacter arachoides TaxID=1850444 RepID=A0A845A772_9SPHN|nr:hypothetical protein [Aurantiacibacter arachoides]MXO94767.1 hypothetical protein [Aurantiacibacter arachoides]GGD60850.1 hypothetical protein GCM10011411_21340 [Aurantiacibacter arachoides]
MIVRGNDRGLFAGDFLRSASAVVLVWLLYSGLRLALLPFLGWNPQSADDWTRLLEVRDWLGGQSWWDVSQHRMNPPQGFSMHWSRLVDLPLAAAIAVIGERWGMALVPLLWLLGGLFALRAIMLRLGLSGLAYGFGLFAFVLFPLVPGVFAPMAIDHHGPQAVMALATTAAMLSPLRRGALAAGLFAATWLAISLEGLPLVAVVAALYGLRYLGEERRLLPWFLLSLTSFALLLSLATRPNAELLGPWCDILLPGHITAFAMATLMAGIGPFLPFQHTPAGRLAALALVPLAALPTALVLLGPCAANPMAALDPVLMQWWHGYIGEGLPFWRQPVSTALMLVWLVVPLVGGYWLAGRGGGFADGAGGNWLLLFVLALAAWLYSLLVMREALIAQWLAIPFAAALLALLLPGARAIPSLVPRLAATLGVFVLATPLVVTAMAKPLDPLLPTPTMARGAAAPVVAGSCDFARLAGLKPGLLLTPMDDAPEILARTQHSVIAASYHRNQRPMVDTITAFSGSADDLRRIAADYGANYVAVCLSASDFALYRTAPGDNAATMLASDSQPAWLVPVAGLDGVLRVWRVAPDVTQQVRRAGTPAPRR